MIQYIKINKFRIFNNISFKLGKYVTAIAGQNATGKSTLLGLLGNCGEVKKSKGKPVLKNAFRTEFSEIFKASPKYDLSASNIAELGFCENSDWSVISEVLTYRITWQDNGKRFRIIPNRKLSNGSSSSAKLDWPTLYLGLGRLFPIGETSNDIISQNINLTDAEKEWFIDNYKEILSLSSSNINSISKMQTTEKKLYPSIGVNTDFYDAMTNSAGQDNLGQLLLSILSFQRLKEKMNASWKGGLLLIDELDATLHPIAQNKLLKFLYTYAEILNIQVVFTTHSLSLLEYIVTKTSHNNEDESNNYQLVYLTTSNGPLQVLKNPSLERIRNDLLMPSLKLNTYNKITLYTEDDEARYFINNILGKYTNYFMLPNVHIGKVSAISLLKEDFFRYNRTIFILDGDALDEEIANLKICMKLPGDDSPEKVLWNFLNYEMTSEDWEKISYLNIGKREFIENGPSTYTQFEKERDRNKKWFNDNLAYIEPIFNFWKEAHKDEINIFIDQFINLYNKQADKYGLQRISKNTGQS